MAPTVVLLVIILSVCGRQCFVVNRHYAEKPPWQRYYRYGGRPHPGGDPLDIQRTATRGPYRLWNLPDASYRSSDLFGNQGNFQELSGPIYPVDKVIKKFSNKRYKMLPLPTGQRVLADLWMKQSDQEEAARYFPDRHNVYHLYTRENPKTSQLLLMGVGSLLKESKFNHTRRTIVLIHGWLDSVIGDFNAVMVNAILSAADVNVIVVDWSSGAGTNNYVVAVANTIQSGESVARFINWLNRATATSIKLYHLVGHSLGGHQVGIVGRNVEGKIPYITAIDPSGPIWNQHADRLKPNDSSYTEVIHTNAGILGFVLPLGNVDFYPNGGTKMPGCRTFRCDHFRGFYYLAESFNTGGFESIRCNGIQSAMRGQCDFGNGERNVSVNILKMGGLQPKIGANGIYFLRTNPEPPYTQHFL